MPLLWRSSRESRSERCKRAFLLAPICKVLLAPTLVSDRAMAVSVGRSNAQGVPKGDFEIKIFEHFFYQTSFAYSYKCDWYMARVPTRCQ